MQNNFTDVRETAHSMLKCVTHLHPFVMRYLLAEFRKKTQPMDKEKLLMQCLRAEIYFYRDKMNEYDVRFCKYILSYPQLRRQIVAALQRMQENVVLLEWMSDWTAFFNFCQYPRGPFYRLLHPVFTEAGATLCSYKRAGKIVSCHNSISSLALLNNDNYMILLKDACSESPGDKITCHEVTPEQIAKLTKFRQCVEWYFLFTQQYFWKFQADMVPNRTVVMFDNPYFSAITCGSELVAGSFWRDMPGNVRTHGYYGESFLPKPRTVQKPKSVSPSGTVRKMVIRGGTPFDLTVYKLCDSASKNTRGHQWRQTLAMIAATDNPYLLDSPFQTAWGPPDAAGGPPKPSELYTYEAQEFEKFEVPGDGNCFYYAAWICKINDFARTKFLNSDPDNQEKKAQRGQQQIRSNVKAWFVKHQLDVTPEQKSRELDSENIMQMCALAMFDKLDIQYAKTEIENLSVLRHLSDSQANKYLEDNPNVPPVACVFPPTTPAEEKQIIKYFNLFLESCAGTGWADLCCAYAIADLPELPENAESPENTQLVHTRMQERPHVRIFLKHSQLPLNLLLEAGQGNPVTINMLFNDIDHYDALIPRRASGDDLRKQQNAEEHDALQAAAAKQREERIAKANARLEELTRQQNNAQVHKAAAAKKQETVAAAKKPEMVAAAAEAKEAEVGSDDSEIDTDEWLGGGGGGGGAGGSGGGVAGGSGAGAAGGGGDEPPPQEDLALQAGLQSWCQKIAQEVTNGTWWDVYKKTHARDEIWKSTNENNGIIAFTDQTSHALLYFLNNILFALKDGQGLMQKVRYVFANMKHSEGRFFIPAIRTVCPEPYWMRKLAEYTDGPVYGSQKIHSTEGLNDALNLLGLLWLAAMKDSTGESDAGERLCRQVGHGRERS